MQFPYQFVLAALLAGSLCPPATLVVAQALPEGASAQAGASVSPEQMPPSTPQVTYSQGQLKISARNSTLREVLSLVKTRTGAEIEGPTHQANERIVVELGPAPVGEVLRELLQGSKFDYVILGKANTPGVERVILSIRGPAPSPPVASAAPAYEPDPEPLIEEPVMAGPDAQPMPGQPGMPPNYPGAAIPPMGVDANGQPIEQQGMPPGQNMQNSNQQFDPNQPQQPKSPEELLRELQMMQQQEQNQNNQNNQ